MAHSFSGQLKMDCQPRGRTREEGMLSNVQSFLLSNIFIALAGLFTSRLWLSGAAACREEGRGGLGKCGTRVEIRRRGREGGGGRRAREGVSVGGSLCVHSRPKGPEQTVCVCVLGRCCGIIHPARMLKGSLWTGPGSLIKGKSSHPRLHSDQQ